MLVPSLQTRISWTEPNSKPNMKPNPSRTQMTILTWLGDDADARQQPVLYSLWRFSNVFRPWPRTLHPVLIGPVRYYSPQWYCLSISTLACRLAADRVFFHGVQQTNKGIPFRTPCEIHAQSNNSSDVATILVRSFCRHTDPFWFQYGNPAGNKIVIFLMILFTQLKEPSIGPTVKQWK